MHRPLTIRQEQNWASLAHAFMALNLITLIFGTLASGLIYLAFRRRSAFIAYHALQAFLYQLIVWIGGWIAAVLIFMLGRVLGEIGVLFTLVGFLVALVPLFGIAYALYAAFNVRHGVEFAYPRVGDWALDQINRE